jgi:SPW repeat
MEAAMLAQRYRTAAVIDVINLLLGVLLFFAPWMFDFVSTLASENAWLSGALISLLATTAIIAFDAREQRLNLLVGMWVVVSPWVLGFHAEMHLHLIVGLLLVSLVLFELWLNVDAEDGEAIADAGAPGSGATGAYLVAPPEPNRREYAEPKRAAAPLRHVARSIPATARLIAVRGPSKSEPPRRRRPARSTVRAGRALAE